jgi:8-oxo-dGTP diphosphatase
MQQRSAVYILLTRAARVLLILRQNTGYMDGMWDFPAGHVEPGESAVQAAIREAREEVGVGLTPDQLVFEHVMHRLHESVAMTYYGVYFSANDWSGEPTRMEPDKCAEVRWFERDALPANMVPFSRDVLAIHMPAGARYAEWGWPT